MPKTIRNILVVFFIVIVLFGAIKILGINDTILKKMYPQTYSDYIVKYANEYGVDPILVFAVIKAESNFDKDVVSKSNAKGLMQIMDATADEVAKNIMIDDFFENDMLFDAEINIKIGTKYLSDLLAKYDNYYVAVAAYNAGTGTVDKWINSGIIKSDGSDIENIPYKETNNYVRNIIRHYGVYEKIIVNSF